MVKDFDFDELDKAVTSALNQDGSSQSSQQPVSDQDIVSPAQDFVSNEMVSPAVDTNQQPPVGVDESVQAEVTQQSTDSQIQQEQTSPEDEVSAPIVEESPSQVDVSPVEDVASSQPTAEVPPAISTGTPGRRGRFMDMVHPSADMQTAQSTAPSRKGVSLSPISPDAPVANNDISAPADNSLPAGTPTLDNISDDTNSISQPSETENSNSDQLTNSDLDNRPSEAEASNPEIIEQPAAGEEPKVNPFIEGANESVEKRPLGGYTPSEELIVEQAEAGIDDNTSTTEAVDLQVASDDAQVEEAELHKISDDKNAFAQTDDQTAVQSQPVESESSNDAPVESLESSTNDAPAYSPSDNSGQSPFITQQYKTAEQKTDNEEHGVFDTSNYHQPLAPAESPVASKKHLLFWIILVVALFIGGGALGALYFLSLN